MRTAEIIVKEYLDRGYSLESLRVLAESRSEPLCSEMLAVLDAMRGGGTGDGAVARTYPAVTTDCESVIEEEPLFFVADDDEAVSEDAAVDFDIMAEVGTDADAEPISAISEESVADIVIGLTDGSEVVSLQPPEESLSGMEKADEAGIWSRMWSRVTISGAAKEEESDPAEPTPELCTPLENTAITAEVSVPFEEAGAPDVIGEEAVRVERDTLQTLTEELTSGEVSDLPLLAENSADYIPGSVAFPFCPELSAESAMEEGMESVPAFTPGSEECGEVKVGERDTEDVLDDASPEDEEADIIDGEAVSLDAGDGTENAPQLPTLHSAGSKDARKGRRRREKGTRKRIKRDGKNRVAATDELPEITLEHLEHDENGELLAESTSQASAPEEGWNIVEMSDVEKSDTETASQDVFHKMIHLVTTDGFLALESEEIISVGENETGGDTAEIDTDSVENDLEAAEFVGTADGQSDAEATVVAIGKGSGSVSFEPECHESGHGDHLMIIANGGLDLRGDAYLLLYDALADENTDAVACENDENVIHFRDLLPPYDGLDEMDVDVEEERQPVLHLLPPVEQDESSVASAEGDSVVEAAERLPLTRESAHVDASVCAGMSSTARAGLAKACVGLPPHDESIEDGLDHAQEHIIFSVPETALVPDMVESTVQAEIEKEYQDRLDEFAARLLEVQAATAESEARVREKAAEVAARDEELERLQSLLNEEAARHAELSRRIAEAKDETEAKCEELKRYEGIQDEHERLYDEFEDLRQAYNEVVTDVMPELQNERDDLALTVERQSEETESLRGSLGTVRRRLAAGYSLAAAACLVLVALPIANWLKSGDQAKELAMDHQKATEQRERLEWVERENIEAEQTIKTLKRQLEMARIEVADLDKKNGDLRRAAERHERDLANARSGVRSGTPSRTTSNMSALQGSAHPNGRLHTNEVRDPRGEIDNTLAVNRNRRQNGGDALATEGGLRPPDERRNGRTSVSMTTASTGNSGDRNASARQGETTAKVKAGEGVAQVVYRVLGSRDPDVINWVIRENKIKRDRRGNPLIYENQELRLPSQGRTGQAASAARR